MILVVGGAGYIGSHLVRELIQYKEVLVLDNLSTGHKKSLDLRVDFIQGDLADSSLLDRIFTEQPIEAVMHLAASSLVGESVVNPIKYYGNNVVATFNLLNAMVKHGVKNIIFSSTAATYGFPNVEFIDETIETNPINPYGRSKRMIEEMLSDFGDAYGIRFVVLRYFNAAGAHETADIGESHFPETHLIPIILQHLANIREKVLIYGTDYDTPDGTCIRDYIHVTDIANAHIMAMDGLLSGKICSAIYNLGNGNGYSVKDVINACEGITGLKAIVEECERRPGDPGRIVASSKKIERKLGWRAERSLNQIIESAWKWHSSPKY